MLELRISGLDSALALLGLADAQALLEAAAQGLEEGVTLIAQEAAMLCPKDTGALAASITASVAQDDDALSGEVKAGAAHAVYVEMGTARQAAQPFLDPAAASRGGDCVQCVRAAIAQHMENGG